VYYVDSVSDALLITYQRCKLTQILHVDDNVTAVTVKAHAKKITQTCNTPQKLYTATGQLQCYSGEMRKNSRVTMMKKTPQSHRNMDSTSFTEFTIRSIY